MHLSLQNVGLALLSACILTLALSYAGPRKGPPVAGKGQFVTNIKWYSWEAPSDFTANGEDFNPKDLTYASCCDPFGTVIDIKYQSREIWVRCNDRGPHRVELTAGGFALLAPLKEGVIKDALVTYLTDVKQYTASK